MNSILAISIGASFGAIIRWLLGQSFNHIYPTLPLGTLIANLSGGFLIGVGNTYFSNTTSLPAEYRLFFITGFLGALTTFSTFSAEVSTLIQRGKLVWAFLSVTVHVTGSIAMTFIGIGTVVLLQKL